MAAGRLGSFVVVGALLVFGLLASTTAASYNGLTKNPTNLFANEVLNAPTGLSATLQANGGTVALAWTATTTSWATGMRVYRGTASGGPYSQLTQISGLATTTYNDVPGTGTFYYVVRAYYTGNGANWESANSNQPTAVKPLHHFTFNSISTHTSGTAFSTTITAQASDNSTVTAFTGTAALTVASGTISPTTTNAFSAGVLTQNVTITASATGSETITATGGTPSRTGTSNTFTIETYSNDVLTTSGLVSYWRLGETSGTSAADSKGTNTGTYTGGYTLGVTGALAGDSNKATTFNGSTGYVSIGNPSSLQLTTGSLEAWIKTSNAGTSYRDIINKDLAYNVTVQNNVLQIWDEGANTDRSTGVNVADGAWHHVVVTFQSGVSNGTKIYLDGVLKLTTTMTVSSNSNNLRIASTAFNSGSEYFNGTIDEAAIYNSVLSSATVLSHYNAGRGF